VRRPWLALLLPLAVAACGEEGPTGVGAGLLPGDVIRTFEVILEPHQYLVWDTTFGQYTAMQDVDYHVIAHAFEGVLDARGLSAFEAPRSITVTDTAGVVRQDTTPQWVGGRLRIVVDSARSTGGPARLVLYRTAQEWDRSATWTHAVDTAGARIAWTQPGGTIGALVDTATWTAGADTVVFRLDAATAAEWAAAPSAAQGALIGMQTPGARLFTTLPQLELEARSSMRPDTTYMVNTFLVRRTYIYSPEPPAPTGGELRVGGTPAWRTMIRFQEGLDTVTVPCPGSVPGCRLPLRDVVINRAALMLQPVRPPAGFRPETDISLSVTLLLTSPLVPLPRSPLGGLVGVTPVPPTRFLAPDAPVVEVSITEFLQAIIDPAQQEGPNAMTSRHLALVPFQQRVFGFASFASMPRLRLILSTTRELQLP
jgi:hypothetical protein